MLALLTALAIVAPIAALAALFGVVKDGSPFRKDWWTS
jgi:hypothetical protein